MYQKSCLYKVHVGDNNIANFSCFVLFRKVVTFSDILNVIYYRKGNILGNMSSSHCREVLIFTLVL